MKKVFLFAAFTALTSLSFAQTSKSTWLLGGGASFASIKPDVGDSKTYINLAPRAGYFVMDNLALGAELSYSKLGDDEGSTMVGPFVRYYFTSLGSNAKLFGQAEAAFGSTAGTSTTAFGVHAGVAYFLNNSIALEGALGYDNNTTLKTSTIGVNVGFQIHFGGK